MYHVLSGPHFFLQKDAFAFEGQLVPKETQAFESLYFRIPEPYFSHLSLWSLRDFKPRDA